MNRLYTFCLSALCTLLFAGGCADTGCLAEEDASVLLQPSFIPVSGSLIRSIVSETGAVDGQVNRIGVYLTRSDGHTAYADPASAFSIFTTVDGNSWVGNPSVNLRTEQARLYAWYPAVNIPTEDGNTRTVPITLPAAQTFDGKSAIASQTDYLYGSADRTVGDATAITVNRNANNPAIYLQHALTRLVFTIEYKAGRVPDSEYDWVKSISLTTGSGTAVFRAAASGTMALADGALTIAPAATLTFTAAEGKSCLPGNIGDPKPVAYGLAAPKSATTSSVTLTLILGQQNSSVNDRTLTAANATLFNSEWKKGHCYTYHLLLDKNDITMKSVEIKGWTEQDGGEQGVPPVIE